MQCTASALAKSTLPELSLISSTPRIISAKALLLALASVRDPRRRQGVRFSLSAILALSVAAILCNHLSVLAIAEWAADQPKELLESLGFAGGVTPHQSTLQRLFRRLNPDDLSLALATCFAEPPSKRKRPRASQGLAVDGKAQRGRLAFDSCGCPVHALSAFLPREGIVLAQEPIGKVGSTDKAEAELTVAPDLIRRIDWQGRVMTGDALLCQRNICQQVIEREGDYLMMVKDNQPTLQEDIQLLFDPPFQALPLDDRREAETMESGHGRRKDRRHLIASTDLVGYSDWPGLGQVFRLERTWEERGVMKGEVEYGITSIPPEHGDAPRLLELKRGHWGIENALHYVKDVTLGEDRSLVHLGNGPAVMAMLRDAALNLLRQADIRTIASRLRYHSRHPEEALAVVLGSKA